MPGKIIGKRRIILNMERNNVSHYSEEFHISMLDDFAKSFP